MEGRAAETLAKKTQRREDRFYPQLPEADNFRQLFPLRSCFSLIFFLLETKVFPFASVSSSRTPPPESPLSVDADSDQSLRAPISI